MDRGIAARIEEWDSSPVSDGYGGLQELADASFSGAVSAGSAWLFLLNGRIVGVVDGTLSSFESAPLTAHEAPDPTLPLLFAMQEQGGETQAKYYTDDNPLTEVHETLSEANFTGYIELSDNVLSGDYYVVYYGGRSMSAAFVGNAGKLLTGDEAFHEAADEVGIYEVIDVDLEVRDVPEPAGATEPAATATPGEETTDEPAPTTEPADEPTPESSAEPASGPAEGPEETPSVEAEPHGGPTTGETTEPTPTPEPDRPKEPTPEAPPSQQPAGNEATTAEGQDPFDEEAAWREARTIPALDPDETDAPSPAGDDGGQQSTRPPEPAEPAEPGASVEPAEPAADPSVEEDRIAELEAAIESQSETIAELESKLETSSAEAEELREERERLEAELEAARQGAARTETPGDATTAARTIDAETALDQTDLFVRYGTKGGGTLEKAHDGAIDREEVVENLRIDHHTRFEEGEVTVDGEPFEAFLADSLEYRFVNWLVYQLLFEIQDTGSQRGLRELFDVLPRVDRVEFHGAVTWRDADAGETREETFDVVCRDRMGQALVVANLNDVRDPATGEMMTGLIEGASAIAEGIETLGGAFMVTSSFFQPDALETASEATGGGLLSRDKRWSYVKLGRKRGYHLCLVEARGDDFHIAVPEL